MSVQALEIPGNNGAALLTIPAAALAANPALAWAEPDIEYFVYTCIKPLGGTITWSYGGTTGDPLSWVFIRNIQVDVRGPDRREARRRADAARRVIQALPHLPWEQGFVNRVDVLAGPMWMPDQVNAPRYVARYAITYHPSRSASELPQGDQS